MRVVILGILGITLFATNVISSSSYSIINKSNVSLGMLMMLVQEKPTLPLNKNKVFMGCSEEVLRFV